MASLSFSGKREEASGDLQHVLNEGVVNPVTDQIEEAGIAGRFPKLFQETRALRRMTVEPAQVEGGQGLARPRRRQAWLAPG